MLASWREEVDLELWGLFKVSIGWERETPDRRLDEEGWPRKKERQD